MSQHAQSPLKALSTENDARVATAPVYREPHIPLSSAEVRRFHTEGFLVTLALCDFTEMQWIRSLLQALFENQVGRDEGNQLDMLGLDRKKWDAIQPQLIKPSLYAPALLSTPHFHRMQAIARQLLGTDARFSFDHCILKPGGKVAATPWHQDEAHNHDPYFHHEQISFWMPLQDVSENNGCMRYIPGSNRGPLLSHVSLDDDPRIHALECPSRHFDESTAVAQPAPAGSCILHAGRTLHGALPNQTELDRLAYVLVFRAPPVPRAEPVYFPWLQTKRTASIERGLRWRNRGGFIVLLMRRLRRIPSYRTLKSDLAGLLNRCRTNLRHRWQRLDKN